MSNVLNPHAFKARKLARQQAKADYDANPMPCPICTKPVPFGRFIKGMRTCGNICSNELGNRTRHEYHERNRQAAH